MFDPIGRAQKLFTNPRGLREVLRAAIEVERGQGSRRGLSTVEKLRALLQENGIALSPSLRRQLREIEAEKSPQSETARAWTGHPVVARLKHSYVESDGKTPVTELGEAETMALLFANNTALPENDRRTFAYFITDRIASSHSLLELFALPSDITDLQGALEHFCDRFDNEPWMAEQFLAMSVRPKGWDGESHLPLEMLQMSRRAHADAADFLWELGKISRSNSPSLQPHFDRIDPNRIPRRTEYNLDNLEKVRAQYPELTDADLQLVLKVMARNRVLTQHIANEAAAGRIKFTIFGDGQQACDAAIALALFHDQQSFSGDEKPEVALAPHYRNELLCDMWATLRGDADFLRGVIRQQQSKATDPHSGAYQMVQHLSDRENGILPIQSMVGPNLTKAVGYQLACKLAGKENATTVAITGDGTIAESDVHDALTGASVMDLETMFIFTDNRVAISTEPGDGRAIRNFESFAHGFGAGFFTADGNDFLDVYVQTRRALAWKREHKRPVVFWIQNLSRLNGHSNAGDCRFDNRQLDAYLQFAASLARRSIVPGTDVTHRKVSVPPLGEYFSCHTLGRVEAEAKEAIFADWAEVSKEPEPTFESLFEHVTPPFPQLVESAPTGRQTIIPYKVAVRTAILHVLEECKREGRPFFFMAQDGGARGGVFQATAGLWERHPLLIKDAPINERWMIGGGMGCALYPGATVIVEVQFGDYILNAYDLVVHLGNLLRGSAGKFPVNLIIRIPVEPLGGGALYHSMPLDGFLAKIPGLVVMAPSTSRDVYRAIRSAAKYKGPVLIFEPKGLYGHTLGDAFPNEPTQLDKADATALNNFLTRRGIPNHMIGPDDFMPFGKATIRRPMQRENGDLTLVTWGRATVGALTAADVLSHEDVDPKRGLKYDIEVIDARSLSPFDTDTIIQSVDRTGRILFAHEDRRSGGFGTQLQSAVIEHFEQQGDPIHSSVIGMAEVVGIPQHVGLENQIVVTPEASFELLRAQTSLRVAENAQDRERAERELSHAEEGVRTSVIANAARELIGRRVYL